MKNPISDENLKKAVMQFLEHRGLTQCACAGCANLAISNKTYGCRCRVDKFKTREYLTSEAKSCDTFQKGTWSIIDELGEKKS